MTTFDETKVRRVQQGVTGGGQFATQPKAETGIELSPRPVPLDAGQLQAAKAGLWAAALAEDQVDLFSEEDEDGFLECLRCGAEVPTGEVDAHLYAHHPDPLTCEAVEATDRARLEADFEQWLTDNAEHVTAAVETATSADPVTELGAHWWTRTTGQRSFLDLAAEDPAYGDADRARRRAVANLEDSRVGVSHGSNAEAIAEHQRQLDAARDLTTLDVLAQRAKVADDAWRATFGLSYRKLHDGRSTARTYAQAREAEDRAEAAAQATERVLRRARALTALDAATESRDIAVVVDAEGVWVVQQ